MYKPRIPGKCPVCEKKYWKHTIKLHITRAGKMELLRSIENMMARARNKPYEFSPAIVLRNSPHYAFRRRKMRNRLVFEL